MRRRNVQVAKQYFKNEGKAAEGSDEEGYDSDVGAGSSGWKKGLPPPAMPASSLSWLQASVPE